jgi:ankyrin repeat protein
MQSINDAVQRQLDRLDAGEALCADAMAGLCRNRAAELAAMPVPLAAALVKRCVEVATRALGAGTPLAVVMATMWHLLSCPTLRDVAIKSSRLKSLATLTFEVASAPRERPPFDGTAVVVRMLQELGVDITTPGTLEAGVTPLIAALRFVHLPAARVLVEAGADVNATSRDGSVWPLGAAAITCPEESLHWLLEQGASLALVNCGGHTIAHIFAQACDPVSEASSAPVERFCSRWLRRIVTAEPSLLEAQHAGGFTPLMTAAAEGIEAAVATLLELGAVVGAADPVGGTALSLACQACSLPIVRRLIAADAASAALLPPGSVQARLVAAWAVSAACAAERRCGKCAARCGGYRPGNCADGLNILRAVLAAGVREPVSTADQSVGFLVVNCVGHTDTAVRISEEHALGVLQTLHAAGVDVLAPSPIDGCPLLHVAAFTNAPALVRWLVNEAGASVEERGSEGDTPLTAACLSRSWASAHALLDCGARVDAPSAEELGVWPVMVAFNDHGCDLPLLRRMLAADRDSLLRRTTNGSTALHSAAPFSADGLKMLLDSRLPHLAGAINAVAAWVLTPGAPARNFVTPLHCACASANWASALALLAAGARVDIVGTFRGKAQTVAEWGRSSPACKHRGLKVAIAARQRQHAAHAALATRSDNSNRVVPASAGTVAPVACAATAEPASGSAAVDSDTTPRASGCASARVVDARPSIAAQAGRLSNARKAALRAARNRAEFADDDAAAYAVAAPSSAINAAGARLSSTVASEAKPAVADATGSTESNPCEVGCAAAAAEASCVHVADVCEPAACAANLPEDPLGAPVADESLPLCALAAASTHAAAAMASTNTCEPGAALEHACSSPEAC